MRVKQSRSVLRNAWLIFDNNSYTANRNIRGETLEERWQQASNYRGLSTQASAATKRRGVSVFCSMHIALIYRYKNWASNCNVKKIHSCCKLYIIFAAKCSLCHLSAWGSLLPQEQVCCCGSSQYKKRSSKVWSLTAIPLDACNSTCLVCIWMHI